MNLSQHSASHELDQFLVFYIQHSTELQLLLSVKRRRSPVYKSPNLTICSCMYNIVLHFVCPSIVIAAELRFASQTRAAYVHKHTPTPAAICWEMKLINYP
jgi:hypothetical protein